MSTKSLSEADLKELQEPDMDSPVETLRHSTAHVMAHAIQKLWPDAQFGIGPTIDNGFYYDVRLEHKIQPEDLPKIEKEMKMIIKKGSPFERTEKPVSDAINFFKELNQPFKVEIIETLRDGTGVDSVSLYQEGDFVDLCRGPHIENVKQIRAFKLQSVAGAYWRGDEKNPQLQRIYGTAFLTKEELKEHLHLLAEAKKRDHRKLGKELDLFHFEPVAAAMPFFHPKGAKVYNRLKRLMQDMYVDYGYDEVITPQIVDCKLWHTSGHYENYHDDMFFTHLEDREFAVKPMNCPTHTLLFAANKRSYRDLPIRMADFGRLHRAERSGVTAGLTRVRSFCQDDAHVFCTMEQIESEITAVTDMIFKVYDLFGFTEPQVYLSTRPEKRVGSDEIWDQAEAALEASLKSMGRPYQVNEGDGAFYGPKIDFIMKDALKREWQLSTIQLDFTLPERFDLKYVGSDNSTHRPVMIHRAVLGSLERFMGVLIEHTGGAFPFWLAPVQVKVIPVGDAHNEYCEGFAAKLKSLGYHVETDTRNEKLGLKIREAQKAKIPFQLVAGDRDIESGGFAVRKYGEKESQNLSQDEILKVFADLQAVAREKTARY